MTHNSILKGEWRNGTSWQFFLADKLPPEAIESATAVSGLAYQNNKLLLTKTRRGWEIPGGHIEEGEDISTALKRELLEEAGIVQVTDIKLFGYRKIVNGQQNYNRSTGKPYPMVSYLPHYFVQFDNRLTKPTGDDCYDSGLFDWYSDEVQQAASIDLLRVAHTLYTVDKTA